MPRPTHSLLTAESEKAGADAAGAIIDGWDTLKPARRGRRGLDQSEDRNRTCRTVYIGLVEGDEQGLYIFRKAAEMRARNSGNPLVQYGLATYWLGTAMYSEGKAPEALYEFARAAAYSGPGALDAATRAKAATFLQNAYQGYHGDLSGLDD